MIKMYSKWFENTFWTQSYFLEPKLKILKRFWTHKHIFDANHIVRKKAKKKTRIFKKVQNPYYIFLSKISYKIDFQFFFSIFFFSLFSPFFLQNTITSGKIDKKYQNLTSQNWCLFGRTTFPSCFRAKKRLSMVKLTKKL